MRVLLALLFAVLLPACLGAPLASIGDQAEARRPRPKQAAPDVGPGLAFVLTKNVQIDAEKLISSAASMGLELTLMPEKPGREEVMFSFGSGAFMVAPMSVPFPDSADLARGPLSPSDAEIAASNAFLMLSVLSKFPSRVELDGTMARLTAATVDATDATAAMLGHGVMLYGAEAFNTVVKGTEAGRMPMEVCVDLTIVDEPNDRRSVLTHGLPRYGGEEVYVTGLASNSDVIAWAHMMARWMIVDPNKRFPTGDTVGRTAEERVLIQRARHPAGEDGKVIKLELD